MSGIYGLGAAHGGYWMATNLVKSSDAAARLASGMRISGRSGGGGDIADYYADRTAALTAENAARDLYKTAAESFGDAARLDQALMLFARAEDVGNATAEGVALIAEGTALGLLATTAIADGVTAPDSYAEAATAAGEAAGYAAGAEAEAIAENTAAALLREASENMIAVDFGSESAAVTRHQILQQASAAMVAQFNQAQSAILALFR